MQAIDKVIIYQKDQIVHSYAYQHNKLCFTTTDNLENYCSESIIPIKITRLNKANNSAFIEYNENNTGYINLPKWLKVQNGSKFYAQLTWTGNNSKQAKFRATWQIAGKYIVYKNKSDALKIYSNHLDDETVNKITTTLTNYPANWALRSKVNRKTSINLITQEAQEIFIQAEQLNSSLDKQYNGIHNYIKLLRELNLADGVEITTNSNNVYESLLKKQDIWLLDVISYDKSILEPISHEEINQHQVHLNNGINLEIGELSGINLIDINSSTLQHNKNTINNLALDEIYRQICTRNLQGIILIDFIKDGDLEQKEKLISYLEKLFNNDISQTKILGFSHTGLLEIIRNKF